jgi:glycosyltransferase involved in cell wall biosynthesis
MSNLLEARPSVLLVSYGLIAGGGETFPIFLANALRGRGWPVAFLDYGKDAQEVGIRAMLSANIPLYRLQDDSHIMRLCEDLSVDIVHSCHTSTDLFLANRLREVPRRRRPKHVVTMHGGYETLSLVDVLTRLPALARVDHFTYAASKNLDNFPGRFLQHKPFTRIHNAVPRPAVDPISRSRSELGISDDAFVAMLISRAIPGKGWDVAREAVEAVRARSGLDVQLVMIGNGPIYDEMLTGDVPDWIHLLGFQPDIRSWIAIADVALLPSTFAGESYPLVLIDFLAMGVPAIASSMGEIAQMLAAADGDAGYVIEPIQGAISGSRLASHVETFATLGRGDRDRMRKRALSAAEKFDFDAMVQAFEAVYETLAP